MRKIVFPVLLILFGLNGFSQDTIRVMYYNLLNYPDATPERVIELRQVVGYAQPDVLVVNELMSAAGANLILTEALNVWGEDKYAAAAFIDGPDTDNLLYYNSDKLGLKSQQQIPTGLRDISEYVLYYKSPGLVAESDTIYLHVYGLHLKAGSGFYNQRKEEALVLKYHLNGLDGVENVFAGGDFNFYSGNESGCLAMRESGTVELFDPINSIGDWSENWSYAGIHTQSTRTTALADGAGGGLDDRFDLIFVSEDVLNNQHGLTYINGTYQALGQDGERFNQSIHVPFNPTVPDSVADALYYMSDHLPVLMDVITDVTASVNRFDQPIGAYFNANTWEVIFNTEIQHGQFILYDLQGQQTFTRSINEKSAVQVPESLPNGIFLWTLIGNKYYSSGKLLISH